MPLSTPIIEKIRDEIGHELDFADNDADLPGLPDAFDSLENIYSDTGRGNLSPLRTALICWRIRRASYVSRGFDVSTGGTLMARRQRMLELDRRVKELELIIDTTYKHRVASAKGKYEIADDSGEFS